MSEAFFISSVAASKRTYLGFEFYCRPRDEARAFFCRRNYFCECKRLLSFKVEN
jgi:hypothetical protein